MDYLQNLHQHSTYCDGKDSLEDIVLTAIEKGFKGIGFSGHSYTFYSKGACMSIEKTEHYNKEISLLKEKYRDRIDIFRGIEFDMFSIVDLNGYDYIIGAMHYLLKDGRFLGFDRTADDVRNLIDTYFGGDGMAYVKEYYRTIAAMPRFGKIDILGHFDQVTKHSDNVKFFDEESREYRYAAIEAAQALAGKIPLFEVNTGAIARGYRKTPYPAPFIIHEFKRLGMGAVITSDCHDRTKIDCAFEDSAELLRECGYKERYILTSDGFKAVAL